MEEYLPISHTTMNGELEMFAMIWLGNCVLLAIGSIYLSHQREKKPSY